MARIRTIKPEFFTSLTMADHRLSARLTFVGLWTHSDDEGRCVDDARLIKAAVWPLDDCTAKDVEEDLQALSESSLILRYEAGGRRYIAVRNWSEHQHINRPTKSKLPPPPGTPLKAVTSANEESETPLAVLREDSLSAHGGLPSGRERNREQGTGKGREQGKDTDFSSEPAPPAHDDDTGDPDTEAEGPPDPVLDAAGARPEVDRLCDLLADLIHKNRLAVQSTKRRPSVTKTWRASARRMLDLDGLTEQQIDAAIRWCQQDDFWATNIESMPKLREKFTKLRGDAIRRPAGQATTSPPGKHQPYRNPDNPDAYYLEGLTG